MSAEVASMRCEPGAVLVLPLPALGTLHGRRVRNVPHWGRVSVASETGRPELFPSRMAPWIEGIGEDCRSERERPIVWPPTVPAQLRSRAASG